MPTHDYAYTQHDSRVDRLRNANSDLQREVQSLQDELRRKDDRIRELEDALSSMRTNLRYVDDGYRLDQAKRTGRRAVGGRW